MVEAWCSALLNEQHLEGVPDENRVVFMISDEHPDCQGVVQRGYISCDQPAALATPAAYHITYVIYILCTAVSESIQFHYTLFPRCPSASILIQSRYTDI